MFHDVSTPVFQDLCVKVFQDLYVKVFQDRCVKMFQDLFFKPVCQGVLGQMFQGISRDFKTCFKVNKLTRDTRVDPTV